jgi:arylsulfatase A-like enzyme
MKRSAFFKTLGAGLAIASLSNPKPDSLAQGILKRPNILFFFPDQHRPDWTGLNHNLPVRTPFLDVLAKNGVHFPHAVCPSPLCAPSRACLAAGKEYDRCGVPDNFTNNYPVSQKTFYTLLKDSGYYVLGCGKFDLRKKAMSWGRDGRQLVAGVDYMNLWGFSDGIDNSGKWDGFNNYTDKNTCPYYDFLELHGLADIMIADFTQRRGKNYENTDSTPLPDEAYGDNWIAMNGLKLIGKVPKGAPWFLQVNFNGPHDPLDITPRMKDRWRGIDFPQPHGCMNFSQEKHVEIRQNYSAMVENIDRWLGVYMEVLRKRGELENTLIVFSSDHGEMLGDHNHWAKMVPYIQSAGIPLVISGKGVKGNRKYDAPVTTVDLAATFLDYAGLTVPSDMDSRSMKSLLEGKTHVHRDFVRSGLLSWRFVFDGRYKLIRGFDIAGKVEGSYKMEPVILFDLTEDPHESVNFASDRPAVVKRLSRLFDV